MLQAILLSFSSTMQNARCVSVIASTKKIITDANILLKTENILVLERKFTHSVI